VSRPDESDHRAAADRSIRHAGLVLGQHGLHMVGASLFAVLVPRLLGPERFGQYALLTSVAMWFALASGLGAVSLIARSVPRFVTAGDEAGLRKLISSLLALRGSTGVLTATGYLLLVSLALGVRDWPSLLFIAGSVWLRTVGNVCFALFLGLNQAARWGAGDLLRRWLTLAFVLVGIPVAGVRGACAGFFAANLAVLLVGVLQARDFLRWADVDLSRRYLAPFLRIGTAFAAGSLMLSLARRSGETIVRLSTGDFADVGYYGAAFAIYLTAAQALWQVAQAFAPMLIAQLQTGRREFVIGWLERLLTWTVIVAAPAAAGAWALGDRLVPLLLGAAYEPVTPNLIPLTVALVTGAFAMVGRLAALTIDRPSRSTTAAAIELATFWTLGLTLAPRWGSFGVCMAALAASSLNAAWVTTAVRRDLPYALRPALLALLVATLFLPLGWIRTTLPVDVLLFAAVTGLYGVLLSRFGLVSLDALSALRRVIRSG